MPNSTDTRSRTAQDDVAAILDNALEHCAREPIHIPGSIQPHGLLLALREPDCVITHASAGASRLSASGAEPSHQPLQAFLGDLFEPIEAGLRQCELSNRPCGIARVAGPTGEQWDVLAHRHDGRLILEFEPAPDAAEVDRIHERLSIETARLEQMQGVDQLFNAAAAAVSRLSGYEKVMIYQFDEEWNGTVIAEVAPPDMDAYLGLRFPASDIPSQARELYRLNPIRLIADVNYTPLPVIDLTQRGQALDLSYAVLRSVSPIHIEYLKNMHVAASTSISIIRDSRLWGLIACHHRTPRYMPQVTRVACAVLAQLVSQLLAVMETRQEAQFAAQVRAVQARLIEHVASRDHLMDAITECEDDLLRLVNAEGAAVCMDGELRLIGRTPTAEQVAALAEWLRARESPVVHTDWLAGEYPQAQAFSQCAGGFVGMMLSNVYRRYLMWFRPAMVQTVRWAGDPHKPVLSGAQLHPRKSFAVWQERVGHKALPWREAELEAVTSLRQALLDTLLRKTEEAAARAKDQFLAVLSHELRTPLSPVLTAASALEGDVQLSPEVRDLMRVIRRNVELETRLIDDLLDLTRISKGKLVLNREVLDFHTLIEHTLEVCEQDLHEKGIRVNVLMQADARHVNGDPARLQQVLWNILKNAIKFTPPNGKITLRTDNPSAGHVRVQIIDTGAGIDLQALPEIFNAFEQGGRRITSRYGGLGLGLAIAKTMVELHSGRIEAHSDGPGHGATFTVELPTAKPARRTPEVTQTSPAAASGEKISILLVEDHSDTARVMARLLMQFGYDVQIAQNLATARAAAQSRTFDVVISDLGLPDGSGNDLMQELRDMYQIKGIALTGWGMEEDIRRSKEAGFSRHITKPVDFQSLQAAIRAVVG